MSSPNDRRYAATHEWVRRQGAELDVGITDLAQEQLGDLVFVGDVRVGARLMAGEPAGVVESVKAASDIHAPVSGEIVAFNDALSDDPALVNEAAFDTWIFRIRPDDIDELDELLDADSYDATAES